MKLTFELPDTLGRKFKARVPSGRRSRWVAQWLGEKLSEGGDGLAAACRKANTFARINTEMKDWERLNEAED